MCSCNFNIKSKKWHFCDEAKRLLKLSQNDFKNRKDYDNHFNHLRHDTQHTDNNILTGFDSSGN